MRKWGAWIVVGMAAMGFVGGDDVAWRGTANSVDAGRDAVGGPLVVGVQGVGDGNAGPPQDASWLGSVQENIRKAEYNITWQDTCVVPGEPGGLHAANRANNLRAYFREDGVQIVERETSAPEWDLRWRFTAWGRKTETAPSRKTGTVPSRKTGTVPSGASPRAETGLSPLFDGTETRQSSLVAVAFPTVPAFPQPARTEIAPSAKNGTDAICSRSLRSEKWCLSQFLRDPNPARHAFTFSPSTD